MTRYSKIRELVILSRRLTAEARRMSGRARLDRYTEAAEYYAKARWLAGRLTDDQYAAELCEVYDARVNAEVLAADAEAADQRAREAAMSRESLPVAGEDEIPW